MKTAIRLKKCLGYILVFALLPVIYSTAFAEEAKVTLLSERRDRITIPAYTLEEKETVVNQARLIMGGLFVHGQLKIETYGPEADAVARIDSLASEISGMPNSLLQDHLAEIFRDQRDLHTGFIMPSPQSCYISFFPFSLSSVTDNEGDLVIGVQSIMREELLSFVPGAEIIEKGDVLLSYDGMAPFEAAEMLKPLGSGANDVASVSRAINAMTMRYHGMVPVPESDTINFKFRNRIGEEYSVELPWASYLTSPECLAQKSFNPVTENLISSKYDSDKKIFVDISQHLFQKLNKPYARERFNKELGQATPEPTIWMDVLSNEYGDFGYLRIDGFVPEKLSIDQTVDLIKQILQTPFKDTDGLIIDVRGNGGGYGLLAETLVQLMTPREVLPMGSRKLASDLNRYLFKYVPGLAENEKDVAVALEEARYTGALYTKVLPLNKAETLNKIGQVYFKPVAVLTNSSCYSACDMVSATLQDNQVAVIYGEDQKTGAGGASVIEHGKVLKWLPPQFHGPFKPLSHGQTIRFAWDQLVRSGLHEGDLIEEAGVTADVVVPQSLTDLFTDDSVLIRRISKDLNERSRDSNSKLISETTSSDILLGKPCLLKVTASNIEAVQYFKNGVSQGFQRLDESADRADVEVELNVPKCAGRTRLKLQNFEIVGYLKGERVARIKHLMRIVPKSTPVTDDSPLSVNFDDGTTASVAVYNMDNRAKEGWIVEDQALILGRKNTYANEVTSLAALFIDLTSKTNATLKFDAEVFTEKDFDFLYVTATANNETELLMNRLDGSNPRQNYEVDLTKYAGQVVEIGFLFKSDQSAVDKGILLDNIIIE